jgi:guanylate kinase
MADLSHWSEFDYVVVNDDFDRATTDLEAIVRGNGEHLVRNRPEAKELVRRLLQ